MGGRNRLSHSQFHQRSRRGRRRPRGSTKHRAISTKERRSTIARGWGSKWFGTKCFFIFPFIRIGEGGSTFLGWTSWPPVTRMGSIEIQVGIGIEIDGGGCPTRVGCSWAFAFSYAASLRGKATNDRLHGGALTRVLVACMVVFPVVAGK